jgi:hypothetical protein
MLRVPRTCSLRAVLVVGNVPLDLVCASQLICQAGRRHWARVPVPC